jgi:type I restriction enzyme S subunit
MELVQNYKQSEVGLIPKDWTCYSINQVCTLKHGFQFLDEHFTKTGVGVVKIGNLNDGKGIKESNLTFVSEELLGRLSKFLLSRGDVLMALTGGTLGKVSVVDTDESLLQNYRVGNFLPDSNLTKEFLYQILTSFYLKNAVKKLVNEAAQPNFGKQDFDKLYIPVPPTLKEQKAIATALSDVDNLITNLDDLIIKKKAIKQGAMQQLLTPPHLGGKRLSGFDGEWVEKSLGECLKYEQPTKYIVESSDYEGQTQTPVLTAGKSLLLGYTDETFGIYNDLPTIIFDDFTTSKQFVDFEFKVKSSAMKILQPTSNEININFMFNMMQLIRFSLGDDHKRRWIAEYSKIQVFIPSIDEQKAIAQILSDMDKELDELATKKEKYEHMKQGMMQELLTGKTRLV